MNASTKRLTDAMQTIGTPVSINFPEHRHHGETGTITQVTGFRSLVQGDGWSAWIPRTKLEKFTPPPITPERAALARRIALKFAQNLAKDGIDLEEVDRENATPEYKVSTHCASHNQCDANMYMAPAFASVMGREITLGDENPQLQQEDFALWGEAWDCAKREGFVNLSLESVPTSNFEASTQSLNPHVIDASRPYEEMIKRIISLIALAIEGTEEYVANDLRKVVERVYQSEDVLWTLRDQLPNCEWFECYERFYNAGLLVRVAE